MNKDIFLKTLKKELKKLKKAELQKNLNYYEEMISDLMENGLSEEAAIEKIGSPKDIAKEILENTLSENLRKKDTAGILLLILTGIALLFSICDAIRTKMMMNAAVAIIGGADGPTSIFLAGKVARTNPNPLLIAAIVLIVVTVGYFIWKKFKK